MNTRALVSTVAAFWKGFDLDSKRVMLDAQGVTMQEQKESSLKSRKALAEHTKKFRRLSENEKMTALPQLLKSYQEEIDTLTKRAKFSDNAFFTLYKALYEAPDPVPALEEALANHLNGNIEKKAGDTEVDALRKEIQAYEAEFATLKNQDITIRNLENKIQTFENSIESMVEERVQERVQDVEYNANLREDEMAAMQLHLTNAMAQARQERDDALTQLDQLRSEVLLAKQRNDQLNQMHAKEMEAWVIESERLRALQLENQVLKEKHLASAPQGDSFQSQKAMEWELKFAHKDAQVVQLSRDLHTAQAKCEPLEKRVKELESQVNYLSEHVQVLSQRPTIEAYEDLVAQVNCTPVQPNESEKLQVLRQEHAAVVKSLEETIETQAATISQQAQTIVQLEDSMETPAAPQPLLKEVLGEGNDLKLLTIIRSQRDRLRDRVKDTERDLHKEQEKMHQISNRLAQLEAENVDLVQKLRFLSATNTDLEAPSPPSKYARMYEERMSPFAQFKQLETQQRYAKLNPIDKILVTSARMLLSHPLTRLLMLAYFLFLHTLVALTIYTFMHMCNVSNDS
ncbi:CASP isoform X2 [Thraustotheca clavata]|uniref:Protein CASP n=1 Tax=Thraustotheca clavata TaxID=74557 RepID=A0A1W0A7J4_9STRA|nr:CASP isoform X2 [Thraustotheca clavata]